MADDKRCETCRWWEPIAIRNHGNCLYDIDVDAIRARLPVAWHLAARRQLTISQQGDCPCWQRKEDGDE